MQHDLGYIFPAQRLQLVTSVEVACRKGGVGKTRRGTPNAFPSSFLTRISWWTIPITDESDGHGGENVV